MTSAQQLDQAVATAVESGAPLGALLTLIVHGMEAAVPDLIASILLVDEAGKHLRHGAAPSLPTIYNESVDGIEIGPGIGCCGQAAFTGKQVVVDDIFTHPNWVPFQDLARLANIHSSTSQPVFSSDGKRVVATVAIYHREARAPSETELALLRDAARLTARVIEARHIVKA